MRLIYRCVVPRKVLAVSKYAGPWQLIAAATGSHVSPEFCRRVIVAKGADTVERNPSLREEGGLVFEFSKRLASLERLAKRAEGYDMDAAAAMRERIKALQFSGYKT